MRKHRLWVGRAMMLAGAALVAEHTYQYGGSLHLTAIDHGTMGALLLAVGIALSVLKPGRRA